MIPLIFSPALLLGGLGQNLYSPILYPKIPNDRLSLPIFWFNFIKYQKNMNFFGGIGE